MRISQVVIALVGLFAFFSTSRISVAAPLSQDVRLPTEAAQVQAPSLTTPWLDTQQHNNIVYFLYSVPAHIARYDLTSESWLTNLVFTESPTAFTVDADGLYVAFGRSVQRFALDGAGKTFLRNTSTPVLSLHTIGNFLYINYSSYPYGYLDSINKTTGLFIDGKSYLYAVLNGAAVAPTIGKLFARDSGLSPAEIVQVVLNANGTLGAANGSPYHGDYPGASRVYIMPGEARVVDNAGIVYNTTDLTYSNAVGGAFDDITFYGDLPVVLRNNTLYAYSNTFLETGQHQPVHPPLEIVMKGDTIFSFYKNGATVAVEKIAITLLSPATPGEPVDPNGLVYTPDTIAQGKDQTIYLFSRSFLSIFRWSASQQAYLPTIPLAKAPTYMAYSPVTNRIYLSYATGQITQIKLDEGLTETPYASAPKEPCGLATAGEFVFACVPVGAWVSHFTYHPDGTLISQVEWNYYSREYNWSPVNRKMYFLRDDTSPNDLHWEEISITGAISSSHESPYHSSDGIVHPVRIDPNGIYVILGSGRIYQATTLAQANSLSNDIADAAWLNNVLFTLRATNGDTQLQRWGFTFGLDDAKQITGTPLRLFTVNQHLLTITNHNGIPRFLLWDVDLKQQSLVADFSATSTTGVAPLPVQFVNQSLGEQISQFFWRFGDGATSTATQPTHTYVDPGVYTVTLTITNAVSSDVTTKPAYITVQQPVSNRSPIAVNDAISVTRGAKTTVLVSGASSVLSNDSDEDSQVLTAAVVTAPAHGALTLRANGLFTYTHDGSQTSLDYFTYRASDGITTSNLATVTITVNPVVTLALSKTVGILGILPACTAVAEKRVPVGATIVYCYTLRNTGDVPLTTNSLVDSHLGLIKNSAGHLLLPGATYSTTATQTLTISTTNVATWTATVDTQALNAAGPTGATVTRDATVIISSATDDQDQDGIPDNLERAGDPDRDNLPNFLDTDADGDTISDTQEAGSDPKRPSDSDNDGIPDFLDVVTNLLRLLLPAIFR